MTNRQLLEWPGGQLSALDSQRLFLLRVEGTPQPCPACRQPVSALDAAGVDLDDYDFGQSKCSYRCPGCGAGLEQVVPLFPAGGPLWHWQLQDHWLQGQLLKARDFDNQEPHAEGTSPF